MWICTRKGFISIRKEPRMGLDVLAVRARSKKTLRRLFPHYASYIHEGGADYPYRIFVTRELVKQTIDHELDNIDYPNFKDEVMSQVMATEEAGYLRFLNITWANSLELTDEHARRFQATNSRAKKPADNRAGSNKEERGDRRQGGKFRRTWDG